MISNVRLYSFFTMWNSQGNQLEFLEKSTTHLIELAVMHFMKISFPKRQLCSSRWGTRFHAQRKM